MESSHDAVGSGAITCFTNRRISTSTLGEPVQGLKNRGDMPTFIGPAAVSWTSCRCLIGFWEILVAVVELACDDCTDPFLDFY